MLTSLDPIQLRVLGALIEKEIATPENYPLSLNSLIGACNQRTSRDPVLDLSEDQVRQALHSLEAQQIVAPVRDARVPKYEHHLRTLLNLRRDEIAVLCLLLLRGPQTPGELRSRADRLYSFDGIDTVVSTLDRLAARTHPSESSSDRSATGPLTVMLARQPGARENRYAHLLGGPVVSAPTEARSTGGFSPASEPPPSSPAPLQERILALETTVQHLSATVQNLRARIDTLESGIPAVDRPL